MHRHRATWRGTTFNARYLDDGTKNPDDPGNIVSEALLRSDYYLDQLDIVRVSTQDYRELRQFLEGADPNEVYEGIRAITGTGSIVATDFADLEDKTWALYEQFSPAACRIAAQAASPKGVLPFSFKRDTLPLVGGVPTSKALRFYCRPGAGRPVIIGRKGEGFARPFGFQLVAFDPFAYDDVLTTTSLGIGGGTVTNPGNLYTRPLIRVDMTALAGGAANFTITNTTTGQALVINNSVIQFDYNIDVALSRMYKLSDSSNIFAQRVSGFISAMWLAPGANVFTFANTAQVNGVAFDFRGAYA